MMLTTGMSMVGKMSVGMRTIASPPMIRMRIDITTNVYVGRIASRTIHIEFLSGPCGYLILDLLPCEHRHGRVGHSRTGFGSRAFFISCFGFACPRELGPSPFHPLILRNFSVCMARL